MSQAKRVATYIIGWFFILLGIVGIFLPFLQGFLFIIIGFLILSRESRWAKKMLVKLRRKYPKQNEQLKKFRQKIAAFFKKKMEQ
jgi:uncharacterized membrane protein YbaN (DUF454 family)